MNLYALNVTSDVSCLIILLTLVISHVYRHVHARPDRLFLLVLIVCMLNVFCELMSWLCEGYANPLLFFLQRICNMAAYLNAGVTYTLLFFYLLEELNGRGGFTRSDKVLVILTCVPAAVLILLALTNFHTHLLFTFDENYRFVRGPLSQIYDTFMFFEQFLLLTAVMIHQESDWIIRAKTASMALMLMAAAMLDIIFIDIELIYPAIVFVLLIIYLNLLIVVEKQIEDTELELVRARYSLILGKMRPEFVGMVMARIEKLCLEDTEKAQWTISEFSDYLRGNIDRIDRNELIPFEDEFEHVEHYINLVRLKHEDFDFSSDLKIKGFAIPVRTLLPIAEQFVIAIDANPAAEHNITIRTSMEEERIVIDITGPVMPQYNDISKGYELYSYVMARLSIVEGAGMKLFCDRSRRAHAVISYPSQLTGGAYV